MKIGKGDKLMIVKIHPAEKPKPYRDLLLTLLVRAWLPELTAALLPEGDGTSGENGEGRRL